MTASPAYPLTLLDPVCTRCQNERNVPDPHTDDEGWRIGCPDCDPERARFYDPAKATLPY